jgi:PAS domain S-box-containing protein
MDLQAMLDMHVIPTMLTDVSTGCVVAVNSAARGLYRNLPMLEGSHFDDLHTSCSHAHQALVASLDRFPGPLIANAASPHGPRNEVLVHASPMHRCGHNYLFIQLKHRERLDTDDFQVGLGDEISHSQFDIAQQISGVGSWEIDLRTQQITWSDELKRIFGFEPHEPLSFERYRATLTEESRRRLEQTVAACLETGEPYEIVLDIVREDGEERTVLASGRPAHTFGDKIERLYGICRDVTEQQRLERERRYYLEALERSNRELEDFAHVASHDLQEPLRKIQVFGNKLSSRHGEALGEQGRDCLERITGAASRMSALIEDLLAYSRVHTKMRPHQPVPLEELCDEVLRDLEILIQEKDAVIERERLPIIEGDALLLRQLFQNILVNALKFHKENEPPQISISSMVHAKSEDGDPARVVLMIEDQGIGFEPRHAEDIFAPFRRLHGCDKFEGTGIGLAICRRVVEQHDGKISAISCEGAGTTFVITLPLERSNESVAANNASASASRQFA